MSQIPAPHEKSAQPLTDPALLAALLAQAQHIAVESGEPAPRPTQPRIQRTPSRLVDTLAYVGAACLGIGGWVLGGFFTLTALEALGLPVVATIGWPWALPQAAQIAWAIPLFISLIEVRFWPNGGSGWRSWLFWGISIIDVASTVYGLSIALADRTIPLGAGFILPRATDTLWLVACILALILTFAPEQIVIRSLAGLRALWR